MDQMCPNWPKNEVFVSFLKFKPSDSADFAYSSSFLVSWTTIATKLAEKNFEAENSTVSKSVSYTHLTLPTKA